jgi:hypothetical protein
METAGACFERCLGQAPAEVLMLRQLEAAAVSIVAQVEICSSALHLLPLWGSQSRGLIWHYE